MKEFIRNAIDTIRDDRWNWKFKLCNIIMNDHLRQNVAFARLHVVNVLENMNKHKEYYKEVQPMMQHMRREAERAKEELEEIWRK